MAPVSKPTSTVIDLAKGTFQYGPYEITMFKSTSIGVTVVLQMEFFILMN